MAISALSERNFVVFIDVIEIGAESANYLHYCTHSDPHFNMLHVRTFYTILALTCAFGGVFASENPYLCKIVELPAEARQVSSLVESSYGVYVGAMQGVYHKTVEGWKLLRLPDGGPVVLQSEMIGGNLVVCSKNHVYVLKGGAFIEIPVKESVISVQAFDGAIFLSTMVGVYRIGPDLAVSCVYVLDEKTSVYLCVVDNGLCCFSLKAGPAIWRQNAFAPAGAKFKWIGGRVASAFSDTPSGSLLAVTNTGIIEVSDGNASVLLADRWSGLARMGVLAVFKNGSRITVGTFLGGVECFDLETGVSLWRVAAEDIGGNLYHIQRYNDGFILGASGGLYTLPEPAKYSLTNLPHGAFRTAFIGRAGGVVSTTAGVFSIDGNALELPTPLYSGLVTNHESWYGGFGRLSIGERTVQIGGRDITSIVELPSDRVAILQPHGVSIVDHDGRVTRIQGIEGSNSIASTPRGHLYVGSASGVHVLDQDGAPVNRWGASTRLQVFDIGDAQFAFRGDGQILDIASGTPLFRIPFTNIVCAVKHKGDVILLTQAEDGRNSVGVLDLQHSRWIPLNVPLPAATQQMVSDGDCIYTINGNSVLRIATLSPIDIKPVKACMPHRFLEQITLTSHQDSLAIPTPAVSFAPWPQANYKIIYGEGDVVNAPPGVMLNLSRLPFGINKIALHRDVAGQDDEVSLKVVRQYPTYLSIPAICLYVVVVFLGVFFATKWRTYRIEKRARELEEKLSARTSELRTAQKAREEFFSTLSHEIRNPLNGVVGLADMLVDSDPEAIRQRERLYLRQLQGCAHQLQSLVDDMLDFSRIDRGVMMLKEEVFDFRSATEGAAIAIDARLNKCRLNLPDQEYYVRGDCAKIRQIISNLISNALKYGTPEFAHITATAEMLPNGKTKLSCSVRNNGKDIPHELHEKIFESFERGAEALRKGIQGQGLGLTVSRKMARSMKGDISVKSGGGLTEFTLSVELPTEEKPVDARVVQQMPIQSRALGIEDEQYNRTVIGYMLKKLGYSVDWAVDGESAMNYVKSSSYDLILTDFVLPDIRGSELAKKLLEILPEPKPPIIAITAFSTPEVLEEAKRAGISSFVPKPVSRENLEAAILSAAPKISLRRSIDAESQSYDFSDLLRLPNGRTELAHYAEALVDQWGAILQLFGSPDTKPEILSKRVHAFRSMVLVSKAEDVATQIAILEEAVGIVPDDSVSRLISILNPMIDDIASAARQRALT